MEITIEDRAWLILSAARAQLMAAHLRQRIAMRRSERSISEETIAECDRASADMGRAHDAAQAALIAWGRESGIITEPGQVQWVA